MGEMITILKGEKKNHPTKGKFIAQTGNEKKAYSEYERNVIH